MSVELVKWLATTLIIVLGWIAAHYFSNKSNQKAKRKELITAHLIKSYTILTTEITNRPESKEWKRKLEDVISEIQLFGTKSQVNLAAKLAESTAEHKEYDLDVLINSLRNSLRKELGLKSIEKNVQWLRFNEY